MAKRPIFISQADGPPYVRVKPIEFAWHAGMVKSRRQMSMRSLHEAAQLVHPNGRILEVSRMSDEPLGEQLSAFNLTLALNDSGYRIPVECIFHASKVFEHGGPYVDLLDARPGEAKRDARLQDSGRLTSFHFLEEFWPIDPPTAFYDWIYIRALAQRPELAARLASFDIFTDIVFNPAKSINCQAKAVALYVALVRSGNLDRAMSSPGSFLELEEDASVSDSGQQIQPNLL